MPLIPIETGACTDEDVSLVQDIEKIEGSVEEHTHQFSLLSVETCIARQHEVQPSLTHEPFKTVIPHHVELLCMLENIFRPDVRNEIHSWWTAGVLVSGDERTLKVNRKLRQL